MNNFSLLIFKNLNAMNEIVQMKMDVFTIIVICVVGFNKKQPVFVLDHFNNYYMK